MNLKTEISNNAEEEIIIRCNKVDEKILSLQAAILSFIGKDAEIRLTLAGVDYFIKINDILFIETFEKYTSVHTKDAMYYSEKRLYEFESILPYSFVRVSKFCILNSFAVSSVTRNITGSSEISFKNSNKKAYVSRKYYKMLIDKIEETRLIKSK